jgi:D-3-phosphoglycerate dehydrogenase / 2-oxoglutarate reductase
MVDLFISTTTFGHNDSAPLKKLTDEGITFKLNPYKRKLNSDETLKFARDSKVLIAGVEDLQDLVKSSNKLELISRLGVGLENVPFDLCKEKNIRVSYTPDSVTPAISELVIALMLSVCRNIPYSDQKIRKGNWERRSGVRIGGGTVGIVGYGRVGRRVSELVAGFGPKQILINDIKIQDTEIRNLKKKGLNIKVVGFNDILQKSDIVSIHVPLNHGTKNLFSKSEFKIMKNNSILINTSRGGIVNEIDLYEALKSKEIKAAGLDVFENEPYSGPLIDLDEVVHSPHQGSATIDCRARMEMEVVEDVIRFFKNEHLKQEISF